MGAWVSSRQENLAFLLAHSSTAIHTANAFLQNKASRNDPVWAAKIAIAERDSLLAVNTFSDTEGGYWLRPYSLAAMSWAGDPTDTYSGWMSHMPDRAEVNHLKQVWDYRWAQPALLYAIVARLIVLKAFETGTGDERRLYCQEIKRYVKLLGTIFSKRWSGIRMLERLSDLQRYEYRSRGWVPMAAADIYGGDYIGGGFTTYKITEPGFFPPGVAPPNMDTGRTRTAEERIEYNVWVFAHHWWALLYLRTGLEELLLIISELHSICDKPWFSRAYIDVHVKLSQANKDDKARKVAFAAVALSELVPANDEVANAARTHYLYEALRTGGDQTQAILAKCVQDLSYLTEAGASAGAGADADAVDCAPRAAGPQR